MRRFALLLWLLPFSLSAASVTYTESLGTGVIFSIVTNDFLPSLDPFYSSGMVTFYPGQWKSCASTLPDYVCNQVQFRQSGNGAYLTVGLHNPGTQDTIIGTDAFFSTQFGQAGTFVAQGGNAPGLVLTIGQLGETPTTVLPTAVPEPASRTLLAGSLFLLVCFGFIERHCRPKSQ